MAIPTLTAGGCADKMVRVYALIDPTNNEMFYIGVTTRLLSRRLGSHVNDGRFPKSGSRRCDRIGRILALGAKPVAVEIEQVEPRCWPEAEEFWIAYFRSIGVELTNIGTGGPGAKGAIQSDVTQKLRRAAAAGRNMAHLHTPEMREVAASKMRHPIEIDGVVYPGIKQASRMIGIAYGTVYKMVTTGKARRVITR